MGGVAAVPRNAGCSRAVLASELFTAAAAPAVPARSPEPADARPITNGPATHVGSDRFDRADDLVAGHARILKTGQITFDSHCITVTNATGTNPNQKLVCAGRRYFALDSFELAARSRHLHRNHHDRSSFDCERLRVLSGEAHRAAFDVVAALLSAWRMMVETPTVGFRKRFQIAQTNE